MDNTDNSHQDSYPSFSADGFNDGNAYTPPVESEENEGEAHAQEEGSYQDTQYQETPHRERKKKTPSNRRVEELLYERGMLEQHNTYLETSTREKDALIADQQRKLREFEEQLYQKEKLADDYFEASLGEREEMLKAHLKRAKEEGNIDEEINFINELSDINAKKRTHQLNQYQRSHDRAYTQQDAYAPVETQAPPPRVSSAFQQWSEANPWYQKDARLRAQADEIAQELRDHLAFNNQDNLIGTSRFFQEVTKAMKTRYGGQQEVRQEMRPMRQSAEAEIEDDHYEEGVNHPTYYNMTDVVAPVNRKGNNMADQYVQNRGNAPGQSPMGTLSRDEYAIARHLSAKKGEGEMDLIKRYVKAKSYPKSPLPGGSPYRLTIT